MRQSGFSSSLGKVCLCIYVHSYAEKTGTLIISLVISIIILYNFQSILIATIPKVRKQYFCFTRSHEIELEMHLSLNHCHSVLFSHPYLLSLSLRVLRTVLETKSQIVNHLVQRDKVWDFNFGLIFFYNFIVY